MKPGATLTLHIGPRVIEGRCVAMNETTLIVRDSPATALTLRRDPSSLNTTWTFQHTPVTIGVAETFTERLARIYREACALS